MLYLCLEPELCSSSPKLHTFTTKSLSPMDRPILIISNEIINPQTVVINYQNSNWGPRCFHTSDKDSSPSPSERCSTFSGEAAPLVTSLAVIFTLAIPTRAHNTIKKN